MPPILNSTQRVDPATSSRPALACHAALSFLYLWALSDSCLGVPLTALPPEPSQCLFSGASLTCVCSGATDLWSQQQPCMNNSQTKPAFERCHPGRGSNPTPQARKRKAWHGGSQNRGGNWALAHLLVLGSAAVIFIDRRDTAEQPLTHCSLKDRPGEGQRRAVRSQELGAEQNS